MESQRLYQQFRRTVEKSAWILILLIFIIEVIVAVLMINEQLLDVNQTPLEYSLSYVVLPTLINMECAAVYHYIEFKTTFSESKKNYFLILVFNTFCLSTSLVHNQFKLYFTNIFKCYIWKQKDDRSFFLVIFYILYHYIFCGNLLY